MTAWIRFVAFCSFFLSRSARPLTTSLAPSLSGRVQGIREDRLPNPACRCPSRLDRADPSHTHKLDLLHLDSRHLSSLLHHRQRTKLFPRLLHPLHHLRSVRPSLPLARTLLCQRPSRTRRRWPIHLNAPSESRASRWRSEDADDAVEGAGVDREPGERNDHSRRRRRRRRESFEPAAADDDEDAADESGEGHRGESEQRNGESDGEGQQLCQATADPRRAGSQVALPDLPRQQLFVLVFRLSSLSLIVILFSLLSYA
jgi:hypothetical protein